MVTLFKREMYYGQRDKEEYETMPSAETFLFSCNFLQRNAWQEKVACWRGRQAYFMLRGCSGLSGATRFCMWVRVCCRMFVLAEDSYLQQFTLAKTLDSLDWTPKHKT